MQPRKRPISPTISLFTLLIALSLACTVPLARRTQVTGLETGQATQAAFLVQTAVARSSATPSPTLAPTATEAIPATATVPPPPEATPRPQITALPGLVLYSHPEIPDYLFQIDPAVWEKDPSGETADLVHTGMNDCRIQAVPGHGLSSPESYFWEDLGRFRWEVMDYGAWAYVYPVLGAGLGESKANFLELRGYSRRTCRSAQEEVLANLMTTGEAAGQVSYVPFASPTPRAGLEGFSCPNMPPARLRVGDYVSIATNGLWLRSEPRADNSTKVTQYLRNAPVMVRVTGGPVCEKYVYWQVEVSQFGEGAGSITGWMAEGDMNEYYIVQVK